MLRNWHKFIGGCGLVLAGWLAGQAVPALVAQGPAGKTTASTDDKNVVAMVNGVYITRQELLEDLFVRRGREQLQLLINRKIFEQEARRAGITISDVELEAELKDTVTAAKCSSVAEFEREVLRVRGVSLLEYKEDKVRINIIARKLAQKQVTVTDADLKLAFDARYGDRIQCRVIVDTNQRLVSQIWTEVRHDPEAFVIRAREQSNTEFAAVGGRINPVARAGGAYKALEDELFKIKDREVTEVVRIPEGHVIALRERLIEGDKKVTLNDVRNDMHRLVVEQKLREEVPKVFKEIREKAVVQDFLNKKFDVKSVMENWGQPKP